MRDKLRKKEQKKITKYIRAMNENIANDDLWRGRFYGHQVQADWYRYADGSGGWHRTWIELRDKKSLMTKIIEVDNYDIKWKLFQEMNNFIVGDCYYTTWGDRKAMDLDRTDYTKIKWRN